MLPFCTTLVSPVTIFKRASSNVLLIDVRIFSKFESKKPSSNIIARLKAKGVHPLVQRSFMVPHMLNFPISPPGKKIGSTTKLSVVNAIFLLLLFKTALSSSLFNILLPRYLSSMLFMSSPVLIPPSP